MPVSVSNYLKHSRRTIELRKKTRKKHTPQPYIFMQVGGVLLNRLLPYLDRDPLERNMLFATTPQVLIGGGKEVLSSSTCALCLRYLLYLDASSPIYSFHDAGFLN